MDKIRILKCPAGGKPVITFIDNTLPAMQEAVGGYIEAVTVATDVVLICNEEGRIIGLPDNKSCFFDGFKGDVFMCGFRGDEFTDLSVSNADFLREQCELTWEKYNALR